MVRTVVLAVLGRHVVLVGIDAENAEVAGLARPHPVVSVAAVLAQALWRSEHESHVTEALIDAQVVFAALVVGRDDSVNALQRQRNSLLQSRGHRVDGTGTLTLVHVGCDGRKHLLRHLVGVEVEIDVEVFVRQFVGLFFGKETVGQVVVLR